MQARVCRLLIGLGLATSLLLTGCSFDPLSILNPDFLTTILSSTTGGSSGLPGDAPGVVISVENLTARWARVVVSYRDADENARSFTATVGPGDKTAQMIVCPVREVTLGSVADLESPGAVVFLADSISADTDLDTLPFIEVDPFGVLLREGINYSCGDGLAFDIRETPGQTSSGYRTRVTVSQAG